MNKIDSVDKKILNILQKNNKISYNRLAKKLKMAASTVHNRVKNMEKNGLIKNYSAILDLEKAGYHSAALLGLSVDPLKMEAIAKKLSLFKNVQLVAISTGDHDIIAQIIAKNDKNLWRFINEKIKTIDGIKPQMDVSNFIDIFKMTHFINF